MSHDTTDEGDGLVSKKPPGWFVDAIYAIPFGRILFDRTTPRAATEVFVGREGERAFMTKALIHGGARGAYLVTGRRGAGKTSFVSTCMADYRAALIPRFLRSVHATGMSERLLTLMFVVVLGIGMLMASDLLAVLLSGSPGAPGTILIILLITVILLIPLLYVLGVVRAVLHLHHRSSWFGFGNVRMNINLLYSGGLALIVVLALAPLIAYGVRGEEDALTAFTGWNANTMLEGPFTSMPATLARFMLALSMLMWAGECFFHFLRPVRHWMFLQLLLCVPLLFLILGGADALEQAVLGIEILKEADGATSKVTLSFARDILWAGLLLLGASTANGARAIAMMRRARESNGALSGGPVKALHYGGMALLAWPVSVLVLSAVMFLVFRPDRMLEVVIDPVATGLCLLTICAAPFLLTTLAQKNRTGQIAPKIGAAFLSGILFVAMMPVDIDFRLGVLALLSTAFFFLISGGSFSNDRKPGMLTAKSCARRAPPLEMLLLLKAFLIIVLCIQLTFPIWKNLGEGVLPVGKEEYGWLVLFTAVVTLFFVAEYDWITRSQISERQSSAFGRANRSRFRAHSHADPYWWEDTRKNDFNQLFLRSKNDDRGQGKDGPKDINGEGRPQRDRVLNFRRLERATLPWLFVRSWMPAIVAWVNLGFDSLDHRGVTHAMLSALREGYRRNFLSPFSAYTALMTTLTALVLVCVVSLLGRVLVAPPPLSIELEWIEQKKAQEFDVTGATLSGAGDAGGLEQTLFLKAKIIEGASQNAARMTLCSALVARWKDPPSDSNPGYGTAPLFTSACRVAPGYADGVITVLMTPLFSISLPPEVVSRMWWKLGSCVISG